MFRAFLASDLAPTLDVLVLFMVHLVQCEDVTHVYHTFNLFSHRSKKAPTDRHGHRRTLTIPSRGQCMLAHERDFSL